MLHLNRQRIKEQKTEWEKAGMSLYHFDADAVIAATQQTPQ